MPAKNVLGFLLTALLTLVRLAVDRSAFPVHSGFQTSPVPSINHVPTQASNHFGFLFVISLN
jgi:hypothetical protein